ncbi:MAG: AsmA family protein [Desulfobulbaceae bacterium]|nr:AsmA family protein [Desulfobulbaceae bacterium]
MNKAIKWILLTVAGLIGLIVIAVISVPFFINPNDYKGKISQLVQDQTGRELSIPGDINLHVSPRLDVTFSLGEIRLAAGRDFTGTPFASSRLAEIKLALWPLLSQKQLQVNNVVLEDVQLNLIRNKEGKTNWQDLIAGSKSAPKDQAPETSKEQPTQAAEKKPLAIDVGAIHIKNINVRYQDEQSGKTIELSKFNLNVGHLQEGRPFPIEADFVLSLNNANQKPLTATITSKGTLTLFLARQQFVLADFSLKGLFQGEMFPSSKLELELLTDAEINIPDEKVILKKFVIKQGELTAETALSLTGFTTPSIAGTFRIQEFSPRTYLEQQGIALPDFSDPQVLGRLSASLGFSLNGDRLAVKDMNVQLDDTTIKASALVNNLKHPDYQLVMDIDQLDLDRYAVKKAEKTELAAKAATEEPSPPQTAQSAQEADQLIIPVHLLRDLLFSADIKIGSLKAAKLQTSQIVLKAEGKDGLIRLEPLSAQLYDGTVTVTGKIDVRGDIPKMQLKKVLQNVEMGPLFVDMTGREEISGRANLKADFVTRGLTKKELTRNANGTMSLSLVDGRIARLQILQTIRLAKALLEKQAMAPASSEQPTGFATLTAGGKLTNGVFTNNDLLMKSDLMKVTGKGTVDLVNEQIDYLLTVYLTDRVERDKKTGLVDLGNTPIPYRIKGSFTKLEQSAAIGELVKAKAEEFLLNTLQKQLEPDSDKKNSTRKDTPATDAGSLINRGLKGLFGN